MTCENTANDVKPVKFFNEGGRVSTSIRPLASPQIWHDGQIIAMVVADTFEAAQEAAYRVKVDCQAEPATATLDSPGAQVLAAVDAPQQRHKEEIFNAGYHTVRCGWLVVNEVGLPMKRSVEKKRRKKNGNVFSRKCRFMRMDMATRILSSRRPFRMT